MKRELKKKWVAALRSGAYRQGRSGLKFKDGQEQLCYCCLGVLAELAEPEKLKKAGDMFLFHGSHGFLRLSINEWVLLPEETQRELGHLNDIGMSFPAIADLIEKNVPEGDE